jgi:hypothetical protein
MSKKTKNFEECDRDYKVFLKKETKNFEEN